MDRNTISWIVGIGAFALLAVLMVIRAGHGPDLLTPCDTTETELVIHLVADEREVAEVYQRITGVETRERRGFAAVDPVTGKQHVWIPDLRGQYDRDRLETWGHELAHVVCGKWHPED